MGFYVGDTRATKVYLGDTLIYQDMTGKKLWKQEYGQSTFTDITSTLTWNSTDQRWEGTPTINVGDTIYATLDLNTPQADASNVCLFYMVAAKTGTYSAFLIGALFSDGTNTGPMMINL